MVDPLAAQLVDAIAGSVDWWQPADMPSVLAWARCEARVELLTRWLAEHGGDLDEAGNVKGAADLLTRLEVQASNMRSKLGLDPLSRARLGRDVASTRVDLARAWAAEDVTEPPLEATEAG